MVVTVRLFATLRERAGAGQVTLHLGEGARVRDALAALGGLAGDLPLVLAVNREYADEDTPLREGDELAAVPPVSGGTARIHARVTDDALSLDALAAWVRDARAGAVVVFSGVTREVGALRYDGYREMADAELRRLAEAAAVERGLCAVAVEHRLGTVPLSEPSVIVAASAPHRPEAFAGARQVIDAVKLRVPIWKQERGAWKHEHLPVPQR